MKWIKSFLYKVKNKIIWKIFWIKNRNAKLSDFAFSITMNNPNLSPEPIGAGSPFPDFAYIRDYAKIVRNYYKSNPKFNIELLIKK